MSGFLLEFKVLGNIRVKLFRFYLLMLLVTVKLDPTMCANKSELFIY